MQQHNNRVHVFIDASNVWAVQKSKGKLFDYAKLKKVLQKQFNTSSLCIFYYTAYPVEGTRAYSLDSKHKFFVFLEKQLGFSVVKKPLKRIITNSAESDAIQEKGNMDVEMVVDAMRYIDTYDIAVFFTGDSDFLALVTYLRNNHKKVYIFSSKHNISHELRTGADKYFDLLLLSEDIWGKSLQNRQL